jgi:PrcB C-terminal
MSVSLVGFSEVSMSLKRYAAVIVAVMASACAAPVPQRFDVLQSGPQAALRDQSSQIRVVTDQATFENFYQQLTARQASKPPLRKIDFSRDLVVFIAGDVKPTLGYSLRVVNVQCEKETLKVVLDSSQPLSSMAQSQVVSQPYTMISTQRCPTAAVLEISGGDIITPRSIGLPKR